MEEGSQKVTLVDDFAQKDQISLLRLTCISPTIASSPSCATTRREQAEPGGRASR